MHLHRYLTARLEADSQLLESLQFENRQLRGENDRQQEQLARCQQEIEESRTMLTQLEQLAQQVQHTYSSRPSSVCAVLIYACKQWVTTGLLVLSRGTG